MGTVLTPGIWYHIEAAYTVAGSGGTDYYTVTITPFGGESVVHSALTFRYDANSIRYIQFISTGGNVQTGSFAIDNFSIPAVPVPEPSSTALLVGVFALAFFLCRRR
ncbi:hypothetical protein OPIT5_13545 [Opitutaceae bacterium TAV5]|nr:hypothetical protein OPIT5_13545 [Opitutaceae bacterium TAV5]